MNFNSLFQFENKEPDVFNKKQEKELLYKADIGELLDRFLGYEAIEVQNKENDEYFYNTYLSGENPIATNVLKEHIKEMLYNESNINKQEIKTQIDAWITDMQHQYKEKYSV